MSGEPATARPSRPGGLEPWRKNRFAVTVSGSLMFFGFTLVMPFLPIYIRELGVESTSRVALWSGLILSISPLLAASSGPIWGRLGDRFGMKLMAERATAVNLVCWFMMGFASNVWHLFILRGLMGLLGGFNTVSLALVTQDSPEERIPRLIGTLQSAQIISAAAGPFAGGVLAQWIGIRNTFFVTSVMMLGSLLSIILLYQETGKDRVRRANEPSAARQSFFRDPGYRAMLLVLFLVNMVDRSFAPITPLFLEQLGTPASRLTAVTGMVLSVAALAEGVSAWLSGFLASRMAARSLIAGSLLLGIAALLLLTVVRTPWQFGLVRVWLALVVGGTRTLAFAVAGRVIPKDCRGTGFSVLSSTTMFGGATGPLIAGALAAFGIPAVFLFNALAYTLMIPVVRRHPG